MQRPGARVARRGHDLSIMSANHPGSPEEIPMRLFSSRKKRSKQTSLTPRRLSSPWRTFNPRLEQLEDRFAPATVTWIGPATGGDWDTAANWSAGSAPATGDDVQISSGIVNLSHDFTASGLFVSGGTLSIGG